MNGPTDAAEAWFDATVARDRRVIEDGSARISMVARSPSSNTKPDRLAQTDSTACHLPTCNAGVVHRSASR